MKRILTAPAVIVLLLLAAFPVVMLFAQSQFNQSKPTSPGVFPSSVLSERYDRIDARMDPPRNNTFAQTPPAGGVPIPPTYVPAGAELAVNGQTVYVPVGTPTNITPPTPPQAQPEMLLEVYSLKKIKASPEEWLADGEIGELIRLYILNASAQDAFDAGDTEQEFHAKYQKISIQALASCKEKGNLLIVMATAKQQEQIAAFLKKLEAICGETAVGKPVSPFVQQLYEPSILPQGFASSPTPPAPGQIMFELIVAEVNRENADTPLTTAFPEGSDFMNVVRGEIHAPSKDSMKVLHDALKKEENVTILSHPQMMAADNQMAVVFVGDKEKGLYIGVVPNIVDEHRIRAKISVSSQIQGGTKAEFETIAFLQNEVPLTVSGIKMKSDDGESVKEIVLCVRATIVSPNEKEIIRVMR